MKKLNFGILMGLIIGGIAGLFESLFRFSISGNFILLYFYAIVLYAIIGIILGLIFSLIFIKFRKERFKIFVSTSLIGIFIFLNVSALLRRSLLLGFSILSFWSILIYLLSLIMCFAIAFGISYFILKGIKINFKKVGIVFGVFVFLLFIIGMIICYNAQKSIEVGEINLDNPNIIFIAINSWRADRISADITPNIYKVLQEGVYFKKSVSVAPTTTISDLSIITGVYPHKHGIRYLGSANFNPNITTLAEILKSRGYETVGFIGDWALNSRNGFGKGFDIYDDNFNFFDKFAPELSDLNILRLLGLFGFISVSEIKADEVNEKVNSWLDPWLEKLENDHEKPFFLFIHYFDPHMPYDAPEIFDKEKGYKGPADGSWDYYHAFKTGKIELDKQDIRHMIKLYDNEIRFVDKAVGEILNKIKNKIEDNTIIIIMGDHGEALGEHDWYFDHGNYLYDEQIVVPLIIKYSKLPNKIIDKQVRSIDVLPTILDLLDIKKLEIMDGVSLLPLIDGEDLNLLAYSETFYGKEIMSIRTDKWKYILGIEQEELYDLENDPREENNLIKERKDVGKNFKKIILDIFDKKNVNSLFKHDEYKDYKIEEINRERLKKLGYIF